MRGNEDVQNRPFVVRRAVKATDSRLDPVIRTAGALVSVNRVKVPLQVASVADVVSRSTAALALVQKLALKGRPFFSTFCAQFSSAPSSILSSSCVLPGPPAEALIVAAVEDASE